MDRNQLIGLFLIGLVIIGYGQLSKGRAEEQAASQAIKDSIAVAQTPVKDVISESQNKSTFEPAPDTYNAQADSLERARARLSAQSAYGIFYPSATGSDDSKVVVENEKMIATFSSKGGKIESLQLKEYKTYDQKDLYLFDERSDISIRFRNKGAEYVNTRDLYFDAQESGFQVDGENVQRFTMRLKTDDPSKYIDYVYTFTGNSYEVGFDVQLNGLSQEVDLNYGLLMQWDMAGISTEKSRKYEETVCSVFYRYADEDRDYLSESGDEESQLDSKTSWVAFKQTFFSAIAISETGFPKDEGFISVEVQDDEEKEKNNLTKRYKANLTLPMAENSKSAAGCKFYFGPNDYDILDEYNMDMGKVVNIGWGIFGWMNKWLVIPIFKFLEGLNIASYGIIILILTVIIKMLLLPLTYKNYLSSAKMKVLKPEIEELNKKFEGEDAVKKQQATMALYRKTGVNPMAGCVPMIIQMPILYAMFRFFPSSIELRQKAFLWAEDLSSYDNILDLPFEIPAYGSHVSLFTLLMAVSTILYTRMNSANMPASQPGMPNMKTMMYIFPVMMLFFFNSFSSGLSLYYLAANVISMGQMYLIKNVIIDDDKLRAQIEANKKKPKKKSNFQKRLEEMQKQQQAQAKGGKGKGKKKNKKK